MLHVKIEIMDNEDCIIRTRNFDESPQWMEIMLMCADVVSSQYGYNIVDRVKFIGDNTTFYDRADTHMISKEAWAEFLQQDFMEPEFDFNKQDKEQDWA
jgi:hypothetical protein